ncbi:MAG: hypothetical protein HY204_11120 [Nitrospirae bacterium]|nr:hypothetical protein [Nitrospirota bacterium]
MSGHLQWREMRGRFVSARIARFLVLFMAALIILPGSGGTGSLVTVTGLLQYEDKAFDKNGFTGALPKKPIRFATVQVVRNSDAVVLNAADASDVNGYYSVTFTNTGPAVVYIRVLAGTIIAAGQVQILNPSSSLYSVTSPPIDDSTGMTFTRDLTATTTNGGGAFNLLDVMISAAEFVNSLTAAALPPLTVFWSAGSCDGTYFDPADHSIHVLGGCTDGDTDEYDDAVLTHEFGHFAASVYSRDDSPDGIHYLNDNTQDIRLSWSEGWGDFFSSAARNDPLYVDTVGSAASLSFNLEDLSSVTLPTLPTDAVYTTNEISVAAALWDIFDTTPFESYANVAGTDAVSAGMTPIWDVIAHYFTCAACGITNVSFEDFWDGWFNCPVCATANHGSPAEMAVLVADRKMALAVDGFEPDDTAATAVPIAVNVAPQTHTLYPAGDTDQVSFPAAAGTTYTIETSGLTNGADTFIEVLDGNGNVVAKSQRATDNTGLIEGGQP